MRRKQMRFSGIAKKVKAASSFPQAGRCRALGFEPLENREMLSLTHLYTFNDGTADDSVGVAHGTLLNGASVVQGGLALYNTGVTSGQSSQVQHAQLPAGLLPDGDATVMVWYVAPEAAGWSRVFDIGSQSGGSGTTYLFLTPENGGGTRTTLRGTGVGDRNLSTSATDDGLMHMAAVVVDSTAGMLRLYLDGAAAGATPLNGAGTSLVDDSIAYLGRSLYDADPGFTGWIDEVRIYDEAVSASQIQLLATAGAISALPGDYDGSGTVDQGDYVVWRDSYGLTGGQAADGNQNGVVDAGDYTLWRDNLGQTTSEPIDLVIDNQSQTVPSLSNTAVALTGASELHITGTFQPVDGSVFHLNSPDAWLFFENIKPSVVAASYLGQVRVDSAPAFLGANVRVVQYGLGSVVIPHVPGFEPLEVFSGPQFTGDSVTLDQYTYYSNVDHPWFDPAPLGAMNQQISSFKLKRGYMATIATNPDGTGSSKVYIAQDHDLEIPLLSSEFDNQVQFVRVLPWRWVSKKGASDRSPEFLNAAWFYNWNNSEDSTLDYEYVPIRQQPYWPGLPHTREDVTHVSGFNEPDNPVEDAYKNLNP
ncbi:MAG: hypothetical protein KDA37_12040, partial [Planctomycetales bacterium]|nr:hypothetical protein [Planctomycetales bacterium]